MITSIVFATLLFGHYAIERGQGVLYDTGSNFGSDTLKDGRH